MTRIIVLFLAWTQLAPSVQRAGTYIETFDKGPGGWIANRRDPLPVFDGVAYLHGPWYLAGC